LDGLDDIVDDHADLEASARLLCITAVNTSLEDSPATRVVVSSRPYPYERLRASLKLDGAVRLQPLRDDQITEYLGYDDIGHRLLDEVRTNRHLDELVRLPLFLSMLRAIQRSGGPTARWPAG
jgi:hypothetical protein